MVAVKPLSLVALGLWLAVVTPSDSFALAQSSMSQIVIAQANLAPATSQGFKPIQPTRAIPAAQPAKAAKPAAADQAVVRPAAESKPMWRDLTPAQQQSLKPLGANWGTLSEAHKRKWLALSKNYPTLSPAEQAKLHSRMTEWVSLSQQQRTQARMNFAETKKLPPGEKAAEWQAYQALSPQEKQKLAAKAAPAPAGATAAVKPVPAQKLANVPSTRNGPRAPEVASNNTSPSAAKVDNRTLLPRASGSGEAAPTQKN